MTAAMNRPLVSILIPTYEQESVVHMAVRSALAQDYMPLEVLVVDDASPTARYTALRKINDARFRYERNKQNLGRTGNYRQAALRIARGEWLVNLDGDDHYTDPGFVSAAVARALADPDTVIVAARCTTRHTRGEAISPSPGNITLNGLDVVRALPRRDLLFMHLATLYRRDVAERVDMYRSSAISSDWESLYRLALHGRVAFMDRNIGVWCLHGANASASADWRLLASNLAIWPSIFEAAQEQGLSPAEVHQAVDRCLAYFGALQLPSVMRTDPTDSLTQYIRAWHRLSPRAVRRGLASPVPTLRLLAGLLGYYKRRAF